MSESEEGTLNKHWEQREGLWIQKRFIYVAYVRYELIKH